MLKELLAYKKVETLWPCYVGSTGTGKTARINAYAREQGYAVERVLLGTELPEDVLGLMRADAKAQVTKYCVAERWLRAAAQPTLIYFDEMDKAREETLSTILTALWEKRIAGVELHPDSVFVCAMQPVDPSTWLASETGRALSARLCFMGVSGAESVSFLERNHGITLADIPGLAGEAPSLPLLERPAPRQVDWFVSFCRAHGAPEQEPLRKQVAQGIFRQPELGEELAKRALQGSFVRLSIDKAISEGKGKRLIESLSLPELIAANHEWWLNGTPEEWCQILERTDAEGSNDDIAALLTQCHAGLLAAAGDSKEIKVFGDREEKDVGEVLAKCIGKLAEKHKK